MIVIVWLASGALLLLGIWHRMKLENIVRPRISKVAEEEFRVAIGRWAWNPDMPDSARHHAVRGEAAGATAMILASIGLWQAGHNPVVSVILAGGGVYGLFDVVRRSRTFKREHRSRAG